MNLLKIFKKRYKSSSIFEFVKINKKFVENSMVEESLVNKTVGHKPQDQESDEDYGEQPVMDLAECVICYKKITEEIMMCPKDGNTIMCMPCISQI